jgi:hypothetical protein
MLVFHTTHMAEKYMQTKSERITHQGRVVGDRQPRAMHLLHVLVLLHRVVIRTDKYNLKLPRRVASFLVLINLLVQVLCTYMECRTSALCGCEPVRNPSLSLSLSLSLSFSIYLSLSVCLSVCLCLCLSLSLSLHRVYIYIYTYTHTHIHTHTHIISMANSSR